MPVSNLISTVMQDKTVPCTATHSVRKYILWPKTATIYADKRGEKTKQYRGTKNENSDTKERVEENIDLFQVSF